MEGGREGKVSHSVLVRHDVRKSVRETVWGKIRNEIDGAEGRGSSVSGG